MSDFLDLQGAKDLNTDAIHISAVANSKDPVTGAQIDTHVNRAGGTDYTLQGFWNALGPVVMPWTSATGGTLTQPNQAFLHPANGNYYSWTGAFPKVVAPGTNPAAIGSGYVPRTDVVLRAEITPSVTEALRRSYADAGYTLVPGSFETGGTLASATDVLLHNASGRAYAWTGAFPHVVSPGTDPTAVGSGYVPRTDAALRSVVMPWLAESGVSLKNKFGAADNTDITANLTAAINWSKANGYIPVIIDVSGASITGPLPQLNASFDFVPLHGRGRRVTSIDVSTAGDGVFSWVGGSGGHGGLLLSGLSIIGSGAQKPLLCKGFCGGRARDVYIDAKTACVLSNDVGTGTFTEFFIFDACELNIETVFRTKRGAGNDSFHGCGCTNRTIVNEKSSATGPLFIVGDAADTGRSVWYNAPLDCQIFKRTTQPIVGNGPAAVSNIITTTGNLTVENFTASPVTFGGTTSPTRHTHAGNILGFNGDILLGSCVFGNGNSVYQSGVVGNGVRDSERLSVTSSSATINTKAFDGSGVGRIASISISGPNHEYAIVVAWSGRVSPFITPTGAIVATTRSFDAAGWGPPSISVSDLGELILSNAGYVAGVTVNIVALDAVM